MLYLLGSAYGELGCLHSLLGNFEQAISCLQHQLRLAQQMGDQIGKPLIVDKTRQPSLAWGGGRGAGHLARGSGGS